MKAESTILGIPLVLIIFILINALIILTPLALFQVATMNRLDQASVERQDIKNSLNAVLTPSVGPTAVPSVLPSPSTFQGANPATGSGRLRTR